MKWFQGSITEAVTASKEKKAVFVVFVQGKDDVSQTVEQTLNSTEVSSRLETDKFVAIKLQSDSENYTFFAQIYQLVPVPSIFFIGENGKPVEIIGNPLSPTELSSKIDTILEKSSPQSSTELTNNQDNKNEENANATAEISNTEASKNNDEASTEAKNSADISQEEKVLRAKQLIEVQNKKRQEEEERKEREREVERRKSGKDVQKLRQQMHEREIREAQQERLKEKAAEAAAREKILKQIAEDKLERKRKFEMQQQENAGQQKKPEPAEVKPKPAPTGDLSKARIQFKLPTGSNITGTFESSCTLGVLRTYVSENAQLPYRQFAMSSFFPRKDFTTADDSKTLLELDLVPSSTILILPIKSSNPASVVKSSDGSGIFSHFFWTLFAPVFSIYNYVMGYFGGRPRTGENSNDNENRNPGSSITDNLRLGRFANMGAGRPGSSNQGVSKIRSRGNVHSLHSGDDDNDENNTWNGNSTQQM